MKYAFVAEHRSRFSVRTMCRCLRIHPSGFYAWLKNPLSRRTKEDARQTALIRQAWQDSGKVYGYRKLHDDLRIRESVAVQTALHGWPNWQASRPRSATSGVRALWRQSLRLVVENKVAQKFEAGAPDQTWVTDITYIRTLKGCAYLAVVIDLYSRRVVGWSMQSRQTTDVVLQALLMAVWRRKPKSRVLIHSDQGSQGVVLVSSLQPPFRNRCDDHLNPPSSPAGTGNHSFTSTIWKPA